MELTLPYYKEYLNAVCSFVEEIGRSHGANDKEALQLRLIGEETFLFIMNGIPKTGIDTQFHLQCIEEEDGLLFVFSNHGRPMNARNIPAFNPDEADATADDLSLTMVRCFSYEFGFNNLGKDGWELRIRFRMENYKRLELINASDSDFEHEEQEPFSVRLSTEKDVAGIIDLVYKTYRYSYAKTFFYNEKELARLIAEKKILSLVAVTESGKVIGHNAILLDSERLGEAGMSMVDPNYRKSKAFLSLVMNTVRAVKKNYPDFLCYAKCVTSHRRSQAFVASFAANMLQLSVYHHADFVGIKGDTNERESLAYFISNMGSNKKECKNIYVPARHRDVLCSIFDKAKINVGCIADEMAELTEGKSVIELNIMPERQYVDLEVKSIGTDFFQVLRKLTNNVRQNGVITAELIVPTDMPFATGWDEELNRLGFFFCGIKPLKDGSWALAYTNLLYQSFDFGKMLFFSDDTRALCQYVKGEYEKTLL